MTVELSAADQVRLVPMIDVAGIWKGQICAPLQQRLDEIRDMLASYPDECPQMWDDLMVLAAGSMASLRQKS